MSGAPGYQRFLAQLKRRGVFRAAALYGTAAFVAIEGADLVFPRLAFPEWSVTMVVWAALIGFAASYACLFYLMWGLKLGDGKTVIFLLRPVICNPVCVAVALLVNAVLPGPAAREA